MDAQSVHESPEGVVPTATSGFGHHKKVNGRKRHLLVDTMGLLIAVAVTRQRPGRAGAAPVLKRARARGRRHLARARAHNAYHGDWRQWAQRELGIAIDIVQQPAGQRGFQVLPRRWDNPKPRPTLETGSIAEASVAKLRGLIAVQLASQALVHCWQADTHSVGMPTDRSADPT